VIITDSSINLVLLDELTYMVTYGYVDLDEVLSALNNRPAMQSVIITGRAAHRALTDLADTVSEVRNVKHAFDSGVKALEGFDY
jgi:cob(I)alamin adenosyltransferase